MLVIRDFRLIELIAEGIKTVEYLPSNESYDYNRPIGGISTPHLMSPGQHHTVYARSPRGSHGDPNSPKLLRIEIDRLSLTCLENLTDKDLHPAGFANIQTYHRYWDLYIRSNFNQHHWSRCQLDPLWRVDFHLYEILPAYKTARNRV
jgi:hypothetical protein